MLKTLHASLLAIAIVIAGCSSWKPVPYSPNPASVQNAAEDFKRLVLTAKRFRPSHVEVHPTYATLQYVGGDVPGGVATVTFPYAETAKIEIITNGGEYAVRVSDREGVPLYEYVAIDLLKAREFADVVAVLLTGRFKATEL